jgi:hypothetical protein
LVALWSAAPPFRVAAFRSSSASPANTATQTGIAMSEPKLALTGTVSDPIKLEAREEHNGEIPSRPDQQPERLLTLSMAAERLGLPTFKIRRAAKKGLFPTYSSRTAESSSASPRYWPPSSGPVRRAGAEGVGRGWPLFYWLFGPLGGTAPLTPMGLNVNTDRGPLSR